MKGRLLVIDDEPVNIEVLSRFLAGAGYSVSAVSNAKDGISLAEKEDFDAVLLDNVMPGLTGLQAIGALLRRSKAIIMMTGHYDEDLARDAFLLGARAVLAKPLDFQRLDLEIQRALARGKPDSSA